MLSKNRKGGIAPFLLALFWASVASGEISEWQFKQWAGPPIPVRMYVPNSAVASPRIVIIMHGASRDARRYFNDWQALGKEHNLIVVVPYFSKDDFAGSAKYNLGDVFDSDTGQQRSKERWTFSAIEPMFEAVIERTDSQQTNYALYGHSAGSQFVHRFMYYVPESRARIFIAANAGWYTIPTTDFDYPYGLAGSGIGSERQPNLFAKMLVLLVGSKDTDKDAAKLRKTPEAMRQGSHRLARALTMHRMAKARAENIGAEFNWQLLVVKDAGHVNAKMAPVAAAIIAQ